jgi:hypothetical protein
MKLAKPDQADIDIAFELAAAIGAVSDHWPTMPPGLDDDQDSEDSTPFDCDNDRQCGDVLRHLLGIADRGNLLRFVFAGAALLDPKNRCVDPNADMLEHHPAANAGLEAKKARPLDDWHESDGAVLWWAFPVNETPYVGAPIDTDWPGFHTHWTPLIVPDAPASATPPVDVAAKEGTAA